MPGNAIRILQAIPGLDRNEIERLMTDTCKVLSGRKFIQVVSGSLSEMKRVLKEGGVLIIGMPTVFMAYISLFTQLFFTTHVKLLRLLCPSLLGWKKISARELLLASHSHPGQTVCFDMKYYRVSNWQRIISASFKIEEVILPLMYPYPEMRQWFRPFVSKRFSSSVFFICRK